MKIRVGICLIAIACLHTLFGVIKFAGPLGGVLADGVLNAAGDSSRGEAVWFLFAGFFMLLLGFVVDDLEGTGAVPSKRFGWSLMGIAAFGAVIKPVSGFWILLLPATLAIRAGRGRSNG